MVPDRAPHLTVSRPSGGWRASEARRPTLVPWRWGVRERTWFTSAMLMVIVAKAVAYQATQLRHGGGPYLAGDWLINYGGGFARRGLFGQLLLDLAPQGEAVLWILFAVQVSALACITAFAVAFLHRERFAWPAILLVIGPAALGFLAWDPRASFRKESLVLVVAVLLALARRPDRSSRSVTALTTLAVGVFGLGVFSWEASALALPMLLYLLLGDGAHRRQRRQRRWIALGLTALAAVGLALSVLAHGSGAVAADVCREIRANGLDGPELCGGAVDALSWTLHRNIVDVVNGYPRYLVYWPLIALGLLPVLLTRWARREWRWVLVIALPIAVLWVIAIDYGRWAYLLTMGMAICVMGSRPDDAEWPGGWSARPVTAPIGIAYVTLWGLPVAATAGAWVFYSFIRDVVKAASAIL